MLGVALLALGVSGSALAVKKGGTLYVKAKNTQLLEGAVKGANVLRVLQPGQPVRWLGADPRNKQWHQVEVNGQRGVVFQSNLATRPPNMELVASKGGLTAQDAVAFANSGAAVKLLADGPLQYGQQKGVAIQEAMRQLQQLQALANSLQDADVAGHAHRAGLFPVVGPSARVESNVAKEGGQ